MDVLQVCFAGLSGRFVLQANREGCGSGLGFVDLFCFVMMLSADLSCGRQECKEVRIRETRRQCRDLTKEPAKL